METAWAGQLREEITIESNPILTFEPKEGERYTNPMEGKRDIKKNVEVKKKPYMPRTIFFFFKNYSGIFREGGANCPTKNRK